MLTDTLIMEVISQCIAILTFTIIGTNLVVTNVVTTAVTMATLIDVYKGKNNSITKILELLPMQFLSLTNMYPVKHEHWKLPILLVQL